jgi:transporter family protein
LLSAIFAAVTAIFAKIAVANINSDLATLFRTVVIAVVLAAIFALMLFLPCPASPRGLPGFAIFAP